MFTALLIGVCGFMASSDLNYIYVNKLYGWDVTLYNTTNSVAMVIMFLLSIPNMILFAKVLKLSDPVMVTIGFIANAAKYAVFSIISVSVYLYYAQFIIGLPFMVGLVGIRSHMSRLLAKSEVAIIFALTSACEKLVPILADLITMIIFNSSVTFFPGLVFAVMAAFMSISIGLGMLCVVWTRKYGFPEYDELEEQDKDKKETPSSNTHAAA